MNASMMFVRLFLYGCEHAKMKNTVRPENSRASCWGREKQIPGSKTKMVILLKALGHYISANCYYI